MPKMAQNDPVLSIFCVFWQRFFPFGTYFIKNAFQTAFEKKLAFHRTPVFIIDSHEIGISNLDSEIIIP